jgi:hypothetical protein
MRSTIRLIAGMTAVVAALSAPSVASAMNGWTDPFQAARQRTFDGHFLSGVSCPSAHLCLAVDDDGNLVSSTNPAGRSRDWHTITIDGHRALAGISCPSTHFCAAADANGHVLTSTGPFGTASSWHATVIGVDTGPQLTGITCATAMLCVAIDTAGDVIVSTNPTGGPAAWPRTPVDGTHTITAIACHGASFCLAVDDGGHAISSTNPAGGAGAWHVSDIDGTRALSGVACPSTSLCVVGESLGRVLTSTTPAAGPWHAKRIDIPSETERDNTIDNAVVPFCASPTLCVAADFLGNLFVSSHPAAATPGWRHQSPPDTFNGLNAGACPSPSLCVAVDEAGDVWSATHPLTGHWHAAEAGRFVMSPVMGNATCASASLCLMPTDSGLFATTHPAARQLWRLQSLNFKLNQVSCPSATFCVGIDPAEVHSTTNPLGGRRAWHLTEVDPGNGLTRGIDCTTARLCGAIDESGNVVTSTNPTGGTRAWHVLHIQFFVLASVACAGRSLCAAGDGNGNVFSSTNPTAGRSAWHRVHLAGSGVTWGSMACPTTHLCLATSADANKLAILHVHGGTASWSVQTLPATLNLGNLSCPSATLCVAVGGAGDDGEVAITHHPTGGGSAWSLTTIDSRSLNTVSCPSTHFCVASDLDGKVMTTGRPGG